MRPILVLASLLCLGVACSSSRSGDGSDLASGGAGDLGMTGGGGGGGSGGGGSGGGGADLSTPGANGPMVALTFSGCSPDFSAHLVVVSNGSSMAVTRSDAPVSGEIQLHLVETSGAIDLSTMERVNTGDVINLIAGITYTNVSSTTPDPIAGTITIHHYDEAAAVADLVFSGVVLEETQSHARCTVDGRLVTYGKTF